MAAESSPRLDASAKTRCGRARTISVLKLQNVLPKILRCRTSTQFVLTTLFVRTTRSDVVMKYSIRYGKYTRPIPAGELLLEVVFLHVLHNLHVDPGAFVKLVSLYSVMM